MSIIIGALSILSTNTTHAQLDISKETALKIINKIRSQKRRCGGKRMPAARPLSWNVTLEKSALAHAKDMQRKNYFSHKSKSGRNVGQRVSDHGYNWQYIGENIADRQKNFKEVTIDWLKSSSHCKMLMNPDMKEIGMARYQDKWVQHFGTKMPKNARPAKRRR